MADEDFISVLDGLKTSITSILENDYIGETWKSISRLLESALREALVEAVQVSIDRVSEFQYPPLAKRLIENFSDERHVELDDFGNLKLFFNEELAGDYTDLTNGWEEAGGHTGTAKAARVWKYGIYMPAIEGTPDWGSGLPTYDDVIHSRLSFWGEKAPYWWFLNYGNVGMSRAYPNFEGTGFKEFLEQRIPRALSFVKEEYFREVLDALEGEVEYTLREPAKGTRVTIAYVTLPSGKILSVQKTSEGKVLGRIGNHTINPAELLRMIGAELSF